MELISAPIDFLGINYYSPHYVKRSTTREPRRPAAIGSVRPTDSSRPSIRAHSMGWPIEPERPSTTRSRALSAELPPGSPLYVTENGCAAEDYVNPQGEVNDFERVEYLRAHLEAAWRAIRDGVPLAGYFLWSLLDNFEWAWGYRSASAWSSWTSRRSGGSRSAAPASTARSPKRMRSLGQASRTGARRTSRGRDDDRIRILRRRAPRVRHHAARHAAAVDQLPRARVLFRPDLEHRRRLLFLP